FLRSSTPFGMPHAMPSRQFDRPGLDALANSDFLLTAQRTNAGRDLPDYYLVYFLLVDLFGFKDLGKSEKIAWSVPIDFNGRAFLIEHRKMGLGVFAHDSEAEENAASQIVIQIRKADPVNKNETTWSRV